MTLAVQIFCCEIIFYFISAQHIYNNYIINQLKCEIKYYSIIVSPIYDFSHYKKKR